MDANFAHTHLEDLEDASLESVSHYILVDEHRFAPLVGHVFKAKTNEGAVMAIYNYMVDNKIPMPSGPNCGLSIQDADDILGVSFDEMDESESELKEAVDNFIEDSMVVAKKLTIV